MKKTVRCTSCGTEFSEKEIEGAKCCPFCLTMGVPCSIEDDVTIKINWHELRILGIWASNYAKAITKEGEENHEKVVVAILSRIERQYPEASPLTLEGEVKRLQEEYPGASLRRGDEVIVPPKKVQ